MTYLFDPANWEWLFAGRNFLYLLERFLNNIVLALLAMVISLILGLLLALFRLSRNRIASGATGVWIDVWRNLPVVLLILAAGVLMPDEIKSGFERLAPGFLPEQLQRGQVIAALLALILYNSAVIAEIFRAGILSLERGQSEAALALGMTYSKAMRIVILPQGLRRMVPATVSQLITLTKDTSLVSILSIQEVVRAGRIIVGTSNNPFTGIGVEAPILQVFIAVGLMFVVFNLTLSRISRRLEIRERRRGGTAVARVSGLEDQIAAEPA